MIGSVVTDSSGGRLSWSTTGKDANRDGLITFDEYMAPVAPGATVLQPADLRSGGSLQDNFKALDRNGDGVVDAGEANKPLPGFGEDRFKPDWGLSMDAASRLAYALNVARDNADVARQWGLRIAAAAGGNDS